MQTTTAIMVDGAFFIQRARRIYGKKTPDELAKVLYTNCIAHLSQRTHQGERKADLYRIFF
jgi:hypothetical protein